MYKYINLIYLFVFFYTLYLSLNTSFAALGPKHDKVVVCYIGTWAVYRPGKGSFAIENIDPSLCTHIVYAFVGLNSTHDEIRSLDAWQDLPDNYGKNGFARATSLRDKYPHLKVTVAIGGWNEGSVNYSNVAADPSRRAKFVSSAVDFIRKYKFDGLDLDWEYPGKRGGIPEDKENFLSLVKELRSAFNKYNLLLTAAFGAAKETIDVAYNVSELSKYLDYVHLMCYDYHGTWDMKTGANAPLNSYDLWNVEYSVKYMIKLGMDPSKLVVGLPLYGRTFYLTEEGLKANQEKVKLGLEAKNVGFPGPYTRENGFMGYNEICVELQNETSGWKLYWDDLSMTPFAVQGDKVISYDDERSITEKVKFAMKSKLAGAMVWSIDTDDFLGDCSLGKTAANSDQRFNFNFPLMHTINEVIENSVQDEANEIPNEAFEENSNKVNGVAKPVLNYLCIFLITVVYLQ